MTEDTADRLIAGVDEVGRGPLVGDVVTAAVILDQQKPIEGLADSKALTEKKRYRLFDEINEKALCISLGRATPMEIDDLNILHATMLAMERAVAGLTIQPNFVQVDGNRCPDWKYLCEAVIKGDAKIAEISAASIIAKVTRDEEMKLLHQRYPNYGFDQHKGYPTALHLSMLDKYGPLKEHRISFKPVRLALEKHQGVIQESEHAR